VEQLIEEVGNDPKLWLPLYLKRLRDEAEQ
jgi:hypothetical protein